MNISRRIFFLPLFVLAILSAALSFHPPLGAQTRIEAKQGSTVITGPATNVRIGIPPSALPGIIEAANRPYRQQTEAQRRQIAQLQQDLGASRGELGILVRAAGLGDIPEGERVAALIQLLARARTVSAELNALPATDPSRAVAQTALQEGNLDRASQILRVREYWLQTAAQAPYSLSGGQVTFHNGWGRENISMVSIPQLRGVPGAPVNGEILFYKRAQEHLRLAFAEVEARHVLGAMRNWCHSVGGLSVLGGQLSPHALGLAFDINCGGPEGAAETPELHIFADIMAQHGFVRLSKPNHFQFAGMAAAPSAQVHPTSARRR